jgi:hypothetical protein
VALKGITTDTKIRIENFLRAVLECADRVLVKGEQLPDIKFHWKEQEGKPPELEVWTTLTTLSQLLAPDAISNSRLKEEKDKNRYNISKLKELGIWQDQEDGNNNKQGKADKHFILKLWSLDISENLRQLRSELGLPCNNDGADGEKGDSTETEIDALIQQVRQQRHAKIQDQCGEMKMLDISHPIALADIYTDVNILEQLNSQQWSELSNEAVSYNLVDNFDRYRLGRVMQERVPGLEAVSRYSRLMVLGKPGAGKTTFLKWVAIQCDSGEFHPDSVPIFIRLKDFVEDTRRDNSELKLWNYIYQEFSSCGLDERKILEKILSSGKALIMLDGLDEVAEEDERELLAQLRRFIEKYFSNKFIITCRISAQRYQVARQNFTEVELTDFNLEQIEAYAKKWFLAEVKNNRERAEELATQFIQGLTTQINKFFRELLVTPVLLNLACLIFKNRGSFPSKRYILYEEAIDILLERWNSFQGTEKNNIFLNWDIERKKQLLSEIAKTTFERREYFFEKKRLQEIISNCLASLPDVNQLQQDSEAVLKALQVQHGLLVERARGIYSFSHLTIHEYLTAKWFVSYGESQGCQRLVEHIDHNRWDEVFFLSAEMMNSDKLVRLLKQKIDALTTADENSQQLMMWVSERANLVLKKLTYKPAAVRAYYFLRFVTYSFAEGIFREAMKLDDVQEGLTDNVQEGLIEEIREYGNRRLQLLGILYPLMVLDKILADDLVRFVELIAIIKDFFIEVEDEWAHWILENLVASSNYAILIEEVLPAFIQLKNQLDPNSFATEENFIDWWYEKGRNWLENLLISLERRIIRESLREPISQLPTKLLNQYHDLSLLLIMALSEIPNITPKVREEIEETLFLPRGKYING